MAPSSRPVTFPGAFGTSLAARLDAPAGAVLAAASRVPEAAAVATIGSPFDPGHVLGLIKDSVEKIDAEGDARVAIAGRDFRIKKQFLDDIRAQKIGAAVERLGKALMVMHSPRDAIVNIDRSEERRVGKEWRTQRSTA